MLGSHKRSELKQSHHFFFLLPIMKTRRTHIPSSKKKIWDFQVVISSVCPSLLLGNQIKTLHHISNTVSTTTNQPNPTLSSDALSISFSRVLLHKLLLPQRVNTFPALFEAQRFITACTKGAKCPYPKPDECNLLTPHHILRYKVVQIWPGLIFFKP